MANQRATWTWDEERMFQIALSTYVEGTRNRWKKIAELIPGKSAKDVEEYYPILKANIEAMESSFTQLQTNTNNNAVSSSQRKEENEEVGSVWDLDELVSCSQRATWTWDEERMFQIALSTYVERTLNRWKKIAKLIPGKSAKDVEEYYPILKANIEAMESSFTQLQTNTNTTPSSSQRREENEEVLDLSLNNLIGSIPSRIFNISGLYELVLPANNLSGKIPSVKMSVPNLIEIAIRNNSLSGNIPPFLVNASKLEFIDISSNEFSGPIPSSFSDLRSLELLNLAHNNLHSPSSQFDKELSFISSLSKCRKLRKLSFSENYLNGILPSSIGNFSSELEILHINARSHRHHVPKLLEIDHPVAVAIDAADHIPAIGDGAIVAEAVQHVLELVGGDGAVFVDVEDGEGVLEIAQNLLRVDVLRVELDELSEIDEAVAVAVDLADHRLQLLLRRHVAQAAHDGPQLRPRDLAIAVDVEFVEHLLQLILQARPRVKRRRSRVHGSAINLARALLRLLLAEEGFESHIIKYFSYKGLWTCGIHWKQEITLTGEKEGFLAQTCHGVRQQISNIEYHCGWSGIGLNRSASHTVHMYREQRIHKQCRNDDGRWSLEVPLLLSSRWGYGEARTPALEIQTSFKSSMNVFGAFLFSRALAWRVFLLVPFDCLF
nr:probable LRR receptor-like serine/threonine-protein kinase At3g47570 [Ipomoea batatas]